MTHPGQKPEVAGTHREDQPVERSARLSACGTYRYLLARRWGGGPTYGFIGVNPSTADADLEDATTRKWEGFVRRWGGGGYVVANLFALRATDVRRLAEADDPFGPDNDGALDELLGAVDVVVPCWGDRAKLPRRLRHVPSEMLGWLTLLGERPSMHLGLTKGGDPRHPLMLPYSTQLEEFR